MFDSPWDLKPDSTLTIIDRRPVPDNSPIDLYGTVFAFQDFDVCLPDRGIIWL